MSRLMLLLVSLSWVFAATAEEVVTAEALAELDGAAGWPVIDVRDLAERSLTPIPGAQALDARLDLSTPLLVVASEDDVARSTALAIESRFDKARAYAVLGGLDTLRTIRSDLPPPPGDDNMPASFTIPSDTCQPGAPLQTFSEEDR